MRVPVHVHTCAYMFPGQGWDELRRTDHILSQEQRGVLLWSRLGLAAGWPGSSKPPQTEWALLIRGWGKGGLLAPHTHTQRADYPQASAAQLGLAGLVLKGSCPLGNFPVVKGCGQKEPERVLLRLKKNGISCFL